MNNENNNQKNDIKNPFLEFKPVDNNDNKPINNPVIQNNTTPQINVINQNNIINNQSTFNSYEQINSNQETQVNNLEFEAQKTMNMLLKNDNPINEQEEMEKKLKKENSNRNLGFILLVFDIIGFVLLFFGSIYRIIGASVGLLCFLISLFFFKRKIQYIKLATFISLILVITFAVLLLLSNKETDDDSYDINKNKFIDNAISYFDLVSEYVNKENVIDCKTSKSITIPLKRIINEKNYITDKSPFGNKYDLVTSYVRVESEDDNCSNYNYYIYITDGEYAIGKQNEPMLKNDVLNRNYEIK